MKSTLSIKWSCENNAAYDLLDRTYEHLDKRKKAYRDEEQTKRVLSSLLAQRRGPFVVSYADVPKKDKEALREALECLSGPVLTRGKGRSEYSLRDEYRDPQATFCTPNPEVTKGRPIPALFTDHGTIYRDGSQSEVPFKEIALFGHSKPSLMRIVAPHRHWHMFVDDERPPSVNWRELDEADTPHERHDSLMDHVVSRANMRGVQTARYGEGGFICINPNALLFVLDTEIIQQTGKVGQRPLLDITDIYGRQHLRWGSSTQANIKGAA